MNRKAHWETVYETKAPTEVSWYQPHLDLSLQLIVRTGVSSEAGIIDIGGGPSTLVDDLLARGFRNITVLDISSTALGISKARLGESAQTVTWLEADVLDGPLPKQTYGVWHDRAVFHFLTDARDRRKYVAAIECSVKPMGHVIIATFGLDGPTKCSGLDVVRYDLGHLKAEFDDNFVLVESHNETHRTPVGTTQQFSYCRFQKN